jgi:hypothetical protein
MAPAPPGPWVEQPLLEPGEVFAMYPDDARVARESEARADGLLVVDLSDDWAPFTFSESDVPATPDAGTADSQPNAYRETFVALANDRVSPDVLYLRGDGPTKMVLPIPEGLTKTERDTFLAEQETRRAADLARLGRRRVRNHLEVYGIPPSLSVLARRIEDDVGRTTCYAGVDVAAFAAFAARNSSVSYVHLRQSRDDHARAMEDAVWMDQMLTASDADSPATGTRDERIAALASHPELGPRVVRYLDGMARIRAIEALQARLSCEGFLDPSAPIERGVFDLATHEALADWERKNDVFSWGILGGETLETLQKPPRELHFDTFGRILAERVVDAAGIIEDESLADGAQPPSFKDENGETHPLRNLVRDHRDALLAALGIANVDDLVAFLRAVGPEGLANVKVAMVPRPLPPYYALEMKLHVEIDRGDVWYDFPFDDDGKEIGQTRRRFPSLTLFTVWNDQRIPLARWRTTIGSWRSERHPDGNVYYRYKNSDVGPRIWKHVVAAPVWIPPDGTPARDLLTQKKFFPHALPETVVNTDVMGPGFQSAYGLVMAIHHEVKPGGALFDNQVRTHGSVDYTSIARRYSHGCHRLVNVRAVRLFGFVLRHTPFDRLGSLKVGVRKTFTHEDKQFEYEIGSRGYYYRLRKPVPVEVLEGRVMGQVKRPIEAFVRKPGFVYPPALVMEDAPPSEPEPGALLTERAGDPLGTYPAQVAATPPVEAPGIATADPAAAPDAAPPPPPPPIVDPAEARGEKPAC